MTGASMYGKHGDVARFEDFCMANDCFSIAFASITLHLQIFPFGAISFSIKALPSALAKLKIDSISLGRRI